VTALVILKEGASATEEEIVEHCRARLIAYKTPRAVRFVPEFPRNALGKVQKAQLRNDYCG
jgi:acyl-coenzyme A synthetase/AMP-(fatty) acid ligase